MSQRGEKDAEEIYGLGDYTEAKWSVIISQEREDIILVLKRWVGLRNLKNGTKQKQHCEHNQQIQIWGKVLLIEM